MAMEEKNIKISLEKAWSWYNSGNSELVSLALSVFLEPELKGYWRGIKTYEDACKVLGVPKAPEEELMEINNISPSIQAAVIMSYRIGIIRSALNGNWHPSLLESGENKTWYPKVFLYTDEALSQIRQGRSGGHLGSSLRISVEGIVYYVVSDTKDSLREKEEYRDRPEHPLQEDGLPLDMHRGLFGCKSEEIAQHFGKYFTREIVNAAFAMDYGIPGSYKWID
jgi:hypothetical protein